ncbi:MAG TPA: aminotransferase class V-fold PLP-dependent enzyme [Steroidobacteraceae bacterium]|nr:aminotransferase class V-fold PLP-dependent enzyme [Steroidobacteraceae bacterium]
MSAEPIYLDHAATTPVEPRVAARMAEVLAMRLGNSAASHAAGRAAHGLIEAARAQVAALVGAQPVDIVFTSGATESNNLAITGTAQASLARGGRPHVVTLATEHKSVLEPVRALAAQGVAVSVLQPDADGLLAPAALAAALRPETCLVSLLHVNNETGVAQDLPVLAAVCAARAVPLHVDAAQGAGKLPLDLTGIALLSFTAHKLGGPQGIGALWVAPAHRGRLIAQVRGGGHERGLRAGTLATHQVAGFGLACEIAAGRREHEAARLAALRERLWNGLADLPGVLRNGRPGAPHILNVTFAGVEGESLFTALPELVLSTGSACNSQSGEPSFVLRALGRDSEQAQSSLRFSFGAATTAADIDAAIAVVRRVHGALWSASPARPPPLIDAGERWLGEAGAQRLGTWVRVALAVADGSVGQARIQVYGCPHTAAACALLQRRLVGRPVAALAPGTPEEWRTTVGAPVEKLGRFLIIEDALSALRAVPPGARA